MEAILAIVGVVWVLAMNASTRPYHVAKKHIQKVDAMHIEDDVQVAANSAEMWRWNNNTKHIIEKYLGQFGLPMALRYDTDEHCIRTADAGLEAL